MQNVQAYFSYWGKHGAEGAGYHLLPYHCLDVAAVGWYLMAPARPETQALADFLDLDAAELQTLFAFFLSLHDLGKFASAFQKLYDHSCSALIQPKRCKAYDGGQFRHDRLGLHFWRSLKNTLFSAPAAENAEILIRCVLGHHGKPINEKAPHSLKGFTEPENTTAATAYLEAVLALFQPQRAFSYFAHSDCTPQLLLASWQLAGLAVLADWVGSDQSHFMYEKTPMPLADYWQIALARADAALRATDLRNPLQVQPYQSIQHHYGFAPTPLQQWAETVAVDNSPQLFILEDVTGAGKTEAALALTHRLMAAGAASGFYFGLPTMATSNAMFSRVAKHYQHMFAGDGRGLSIVLAHGAREMNDGFREAVLHADNPDSVYTASDITATAHCNRWFADSRKKALLAPVGVGTIDQVLLAVLPRRHQSLRLLGLRNKVLVFDEVHAADDYMFELLESVLALHLHHGGSAILLTATLSRRQRRRLTDIWLQHGGLPVQPLQQNAFPLATRVSLTAAKPVDEQPLVSRAAVSRAAVSRAAVSRSVGLSLVHSVDDCLATLLAAVNAGQCAVWVRNSVNDAQEAYQLLRQHLGQQAAAQPFAVQPDAAQPDAAQPEHCLLFHSRFVLQDRKAIEQRVLTLFGKAGDAQVRAGKVLIATQVFQESIDADADVMISDLCPIDDLIQRAGRLHRHCRNGQGAYDATQPDAREPPRLVVHCPAWSDNPAEDWLAREFMNTQYVYRSPGRLWLGLRELRRLGGVAMPQDARQLIEAVYGDHAYGEIPAPLVDAENRLLGENRAKAARAASQAIDWQHYGYCDRSAAAWHEDLTDINTRYADRETVDVLLLRETPDGLIPWVDAGPFSVALSKVTLAKNTYADKLAAIPTHLEAAVERFQRSHPQAAYMQCWLPAYDSGFGYNAHIGFHAQEK